jgi:hypothetical protein
MRDINGNYLTAEGDGGLRQDAGPRGGEAIQRFARDTSSGKTTHAQSALFGT